MNLEVGDLITISASNYLVMDMVPYGGINYAFVNKMTKKEEPTDEYYVFKIVDDGVTKAVDEEMLNILVPLFSKNVNKMAQKMLDEVDVK